MNGGSLPFHFEDLPFDIIYEILGHLPVADVLRSRQVCQRLCQASYERSIWVHVYQRSNLLLPDGPLVSQSALQLEDLLVRAAKLDWNWTSPQPATIFSQRRFPSDLPTYDFDANVIAGRFLQVAQSHGICWYDLDTTDMSNPILTYPCSTIVTLPGFLSHQVNANGEGPGSVWVSFMSLTTSGSRIMILKLQFTNTELKLKLHAEIPVDNVIGIKMDHDWLLPIRESTSADVRDLFHIPSQSTVHFRMHEKLQHISDFNNLKYAITPRFLFVLFSLGSETLVDAYALPKSPSECPLKFLSPSHSGTYPHAIFRLQFVEAVSSQPSILDDFENLRITFLALVFVGRSPTTWTSKIGLHLFDALTDLNGTLTFVTQSCQTLNVGIATTSLSSSSQSGRCLAVTHSTPGPVVLVHHIQRLNSRCIMSVKPLNLPRGLQSRDMLAFDGFRGRLCLINGWTHIDVLDYV